MKSYGDEQLYFETGQYVGSVGNFSRDMENMNQMGMLEIKTKKK